MSYNPSISTIVSKPLGMSQAGATDARSMFYDALNFIYRPYQSTLEVLAYLDLSKYRNGNFLIYINATGVLQVNGTFLGGSVVAYWFQNGTGDSDLVVFNNQDAAATSFPSTQTLGISTSGSDQTSAINAAAANAAYRGIVINNVGGGAITISGTVNMQGKFLLFRSGTYFTGGGTISNAVIQATNRQKCFDISVNVATSSVAGEYFSVQWYGAIGDNVTDNQPFLQKTSDTVIANASTMGNGICIPGMSAQYKIDAPWNLYKWNGTQYTQWNLRIVGTFDIQGSPVVGFPRIRPTFTDTFAIGVQRATGGSISGLSIEGMFTTSISYDTFIQSSFGAVSSTRNNQYSPYSGIVIDPFQNAAGGLDPADEYPGLHSWYRGTSSNGGSTDFKISNCVVQGFTVDICNSPNGQTQQGENCTIEYCRLDYANVAIAYCQKQSDRTKVMACRSWNYVWTGIDTSTYGLRKGSITEINGYNFAGAVNKLFNINVTKGCSISNIYAESFFQIGNVAASTGGITMTNTEFNFGASVWQPQVHGSFQNVAATGFAWRYFDDLFNKRLRFGIATNCIFNDIFFDQPPFIITQNQNQLNNVTFNNCICANGVNILGMKSDMYSLQSAQFTPIPYGKFKIQDNTGVIGTGVSVSGSPTLSTVYWDYDCADFNRYVNGFASGVTITPNVSRQATFTPAAGMINRCLANDILIDDNTGNVIGRILSVDIGGNSVTITEIPINISAGTFTLDLIYFLDTPCPFVGDTASGGANVTNVCPTIATGSISGTISVNDRYDHPAFPKGTYVTAYNTGTAVLTMSVNANKNATRQDFANGLPIQTVYSYYAPNNAALNSYNKAFLGRTVWNEMVNSISSSAGVSTTWSFNKGGYLNAANLGLAAAYQAEFAIQPPIRFNGTNFQWYNTYTDTWTILT